MSAQTSHYPRGFWLGMIGGSAVILIVVIGGAGWAVRKDSQLLATRQAERARLSEITWSGLCPVVGLSGDQLKVQCNGKTYVADRSISLSYSLNQGPVNCRLDGYNESEYSTPHCDPRPFKPAP